jgi:CheY-like chemotaxis protein
VEDEILIRMDVVDQLEGQGYTLLEAASGRQALEIIAQADRVDIVFTDVDMPGGIDGLRLACEIDARWPSIGIILTSGKAVPAKRSLPQGSRFYPKPYSPEAVHTAIVQMLAS